MSSSISIFAPNLARPSSSSTGHTTPNHQANVLIIVPDNKHIKSSLHSSFEEILQSDADFKHESLPCYDVLEWKEDEAIDSGSFEIKDYIKLVKQVASKYLDYDGFVILDSISTMAYTSCYLSFMFENLAKPIVLTGSHSNSFNQIFSDAKSNLLYSLIVAGHTDICEVMVCFNKKIFRGNRIHQVNKTHDPFVTHNYPELGHFASSNLLLTNHCMRHVVKKRFISFTKLFPNIIVIHLIPQLMDSTLRLLLFTQLTKRRKSRRTPRISQPMSTSMTASEKTEQLSSPSPLSTSLSLNEPVPFFKLPTKINISPSNHPNENDSNRYKRAKSLPQSLHSTNSKGSPMSRSASKGVVISLFGVGNAPTRESFKEILKTAINEYDCEIVITCQSAKGGMDTTAYQTGNFLSDLDLITANDMTVECCAAKLAYLMGKGYRGKQLKELYETNLRGELTEVSEYKRRVVQHIPMNVQNVDSLSDDDEEIMQMSDEETNDQNKKENGVN